MGKKKIEEMEKMKVKFIEGCSGNNIPKEKVEKILKDWEAFARYAFNKSHATCYAFVAYQTAYLKAHYPAEFMAANLGRNLHDIKKITHLISETKRMGIDVLRPDINESSASFTVTTDGIIRFGLAAIKGVGDAAVEQLVSEREKNKFYTSVFNMAKRVNLKSLNKRSFEALTKAGAFDGFGEIHRAQYFHNEENENTIFLEKIIRHGSAYQEQQQSQQVSLFGDTEVFEIRDPELPECKPWSMPMQLSYEKEITGFYISGHPLDDYNQTMDRFCNIKIDELRNNMSKYKDHQVKFAGMITESAQKTSKRGDPFGTFMIEDFSGNLSLTLFSENYLKRKHMLDQGNNIFITGRVEERRHQPGIFQINITDIYLLSETMERLSKSIIIELKASDITESLSDDIIALCQTHTGSTPLKVRLYDSESKLDVTLKSGNAKVDPRMFYKAISENEKLKCKIS
jgi:DNA polymerase-3 subunit alpha